METDSRAAALVLDSIDSSTLRGEEAALYALLKTQADYKGYKRLTSDSLPLIATHYYGTRRKTERAALSQYYLGCAYGDMHRDLDAIDAAFAAAKECKGKPTCILASCVKGKGVSFMEDKCEWHGSAPNAEQYEIAMAELNAALAELEA